MKKAKAFQQLYSSEKLAPWKLWLAFAILVTVMSLVARTSGRKVPWLLASFRAVSGQKVNLDPYDLRIEHSPIDDRSHVETGL
jgi:hypothetical protein